MNQEQTDRFWSYVNKSGPTVEYVGTPCWVWTKTKDKNGYGRFSLESNRYERAHRLSFKMAFGDFVDGLMILHKCDNPSCVRPDHLFAGTAKDNAIDAAAKGRVATGDRNGSRKHIERRPRGEAHGLHKLTDEQVEEIVRCYDSGETIRSLSRRFGVSRTPITRIVRREAWKHLFEGVDMMPVSDE